MAMLVILSLFAIPAHAAPGAIWTTTGQCGTDQQDVNQYTVGETVFVNGDGFPPGTYDWSIRGQPGKASNDPKMVVASGTVTADRDGSFCSPLYTVAGDDGGEYKVTVGDKQDNYRVEATVPEPMTCVDALQDGLLTGSISGNTATVTNNAATGFDVSLVSYRMYAALIDDQTHFDSETLNVPADSSVQFDIDVPACGYQIDLVCGSPITEGAPYYGNRVIDSEFVNQENYCTQAAGSSGASISATLTAVADHSQDGGYILTCAADGFSPTSYNWYYGNGEILYGSSLSSTYQHYTDGHHIAACTAVGTEDWATAVADIHVE